MKNKHSSLMEYYTMTPINDRLTHTYTYIMAISTMIIAMIISSKMSMTGILKLLYNPFLQLGSLFQLLGWIVYLKGTRVSEYALLNPKGNLKLEKARHGHIQLIQFTSPRDFIDGDFLKRSTSLNSKYKRKSVDLMRNDLKNESLTNTKNTNSVDTKGRSSGVISMFQENIKQFNSTTPTGTTRFKTNNGTADKGTLHSVQVYLSKWSVPTQRDCTLLRPFKLHNTKPTEENTTR
ncbi:hypothetical protein CANARDRAFT_22826 [[Candida] arabinofermentans NRRL YB-2248]|uniref:Uncharacterized protein n=1 Tax=[Candida] arabinofermentans NRRL YB-2248 TaxID=983967 RepID=A0A1E4T2T3_9ASCO|nr:hypothetical protein CANARDRAFT_22826 [[Candida] arabinofermentans NRRL YB-2248]